MKNADPRLNDIKDEIKNIKKILVRYKGQEKESGEKTRKTRGEARIDELRERHAWLLLDAGEYHEGLTLYKTLPWGTYGEEKYIGISRALIELEEYHEAEKFLIKRLRRFPGSGSLLVARGLLHRRLGDDFAALEDFQSALTLTPGDRHALYDQAISLNSLGYYDEAVSILRKLVKKYPDDPEYLIEIGYSLLEQGNPQDAIQYYLKANKTGYESPNVYGGLCCAYIDLGMKTEALEIASEGLRKFPDKHPGLYENLGEAYRDMGWRDDALDILNKGLEKFPNDERLKSLLKEIEDKDDNSDLNNKLRLTGVFVILSEFLKKLSKKRL